MNMLLETLVVVGPSMILTRHVRLCILGGVFGEAVVSYARPEAISERSRQFLTCLKARDNVVRYRGWWCLCGSACGWFRNWGLHNSRTPAQSSWSVHCTTHPPMDCRMVLRLMSRRHSLFLSSSLGKHKQFFIIPYNTYKEVRIIWLSQGWCMGLC